MRRIIIPNPTPGENGFSRFHSREAGVPVYPYRNRADGIFDQTVQVPAQNEMGVLGRAVRTLYESDKWNSPGDTIKYYHDHGRGVKFYEPLAERPELIPESFPYAFPDEMYVIGECIGLVVIPHWAKKKVEAKMRGRNTLLASPDGWVSKLRPKRCFLAVLNRDTGKVEAMIAGGNLRITSHGIEG